MISIIMPRTGHHGPRVHHGPSRPITGPSRVVTGSSRPITGPSMAQSCITQCILLCMCTSYYACTMEFSKKIYLYIYLTRIIWSRSYQEIRKAVAEGQVQVVRTCRIAWLPQSAYNDYGDMRTQYTHDGMYVMCYMLWTFHIRVYKSYEH